MGSKKVKDEVVQIDELGEVVEDLEEKKFREPVLTKKDYLRTTFRSFSLQSSFNYGNYQGLGYSYVLFPALQKIYKNNEDELKESVIGNIEFFNTNPQVVPFITNLHLAMLDAGQSVEDSRTIKLALMGPLGGVGGSIFQFGFAPILASIGASLAAEGLVLGPILFFVGIMAVLLTGKMLTGYYGYRLGTTAMDTIDEKMESIARLGAIVGVTVVTSLAMSFIKIDVPFKYVSTMPDGTVNEIVFQAVLDKIAPDLLIVLFVMFIFRLINKHKWTTYKLIVLTIGIGMLASVLGILV